MTTHTTGSAVIKFVSQAHVHLPDEECPSCGQIIPPEKLEEIKGKIATKERERAVAITVSLERKFNEERAAAARTHQNEVAEWRDSLHRAAEAKKRAEDATAALANQLDEVQRDRVNAIAAAEKEATREAEILASQNLTAVRIAHQKSEAALQERIAAAETATQEAKAAMQETVAAAVAEKLAEVQAAHQESEANLRNRIAAAEAAVEQAQANIQQAVNVAVTEKLAEAKAEYQESEVALKARIAAAETAAEDARAATQQAVAAAVEAKLMEVQSAHQESEAVLQVRIKTAEQTAAEANELLRQKQAESAQAAVLANLKIADAENQLNALKEQQTKSLDDQREILAKDKEEALNAQAAKNFEEHQKLSNKVGELTRALEKKTNEELGEGAEVDLYETLREQFPEDNITRIKKGEKGADILHIVVLKGRECGSILYDSKNHKAYRSEHVDKLRADQLAANADHAILSTHKFPQGAGQLHSINGVLLANPARVVQLALLVRQHTIQMYTLKVSSIERDSKTEALYKFITSTRCASLFERIDDKAAELFVLQEKEIRQHKSHWETQGKTLRQIQKAKADLETEISIIVGTAHELDEEPAIGSGVSVEALEA